MTFVGKLVSCNQILSRYIILSSEKGTGRLPSKSGERNTGFGIINPSLKIRSVFAFTCLLWLCNSRLSSTQQLHLLCTVSETCMSTYTYAYTFVVDSRCQREQCCNTTSNSTHGDIFHLDFQSDLPTYFDVSVRNPLQPSYIVEAANCPEAAAEAGVWRRASVMKTYLS